MGRIDFARVSSAPWFMAPKFFTEIFEGNMGSPVSLNWNFIPVMLILFRAEISNITDTIGCYQATAKLVGQKLTKERTNRGIFVETAVFFVVIPWAIYGVAMVIILGTIIFVGIQMMFAMEMTETKKLIAGFSMTSGSALSLYLRT